MIWYLLLLYIIIILILIIILINNNNNNNNLEIDIYNNEEDNNLIIFNKNNKLNKELIRYCNYNNIILNDLSNINNKIILIINKLKNNNFKLNYNTNFNFFIKLLNNLNYIYFYNTNIYIYKDYDSNIKFNKKKKIDINVLDKGYGYFDINNKGLILSDKYINNFLYSIKLQFKLPNIIDSIILNRIESKKINRIPKVIYQTFKYRLIPDSINILINKTLNLNKEYVYKFYDDIDQREYIKENFPKYLKYYDDLIPAAYKADFWRACIIYKEGGVYFDIKLELNYKLDDIIKKNTDMILTHDIKDGLYNAFFASYPKNPIMKLYIEKMCDNIKNNYKGKSTLDITGPKCMKKVFHKYYNYEIDKLGYMNIKGDNILFFKLNFPHIIDNKNNIIITTRNNNIIKENNLITTILDKHYELYYNENNIYKKLKKKK